jgi:eukaryotic-like serine/threonine-protein kinase
MEAERFKQIDEIFEAALELESFQRDIFLDNACGRDLELRKEVESLLQAYAKAEDFIESPALEVAAQSLADAQGVSHTSRIDQIIGPYKIISLLGAGGMGEVYLAEDSRLGRKVALKLLPAHFTQDAERVQRFKREARAASALNHPNILTIYEIGQENDTYFIATEFIEGHTIHHHINHAKMRMRQAVDVAMQIAGALSAAHAAGIVHRDIKPQNIMLRSDGYVKVLDFGLAKLTEQGAPDTLQTIPSARTDPGRVMGTISYMSPEQALGQEVDPRTDLFSLGVMLYEMVTGSAPFKGNSAAAIFDEILNKKPEPIATSNPEISVEFERIIYRTLEKDREVRYQTASDLRAELKLLQRNLDSGATNSASAPNATSPVARRNSIPFLAKASLLVLALAAISMAVISIGVWIRFPQGNISGPNWADAKTTKVTDLAGAEIFPNLAPDGKSLIYASRISGNWDIYSKRIGAKKAENLTESSLEDDTQPAFSFNGKRIAFRSSREGGGIFIMTETGESPKKLVGFGYNPAWSPDGKEIVCTENSVEGNSRTLNPSRMWVVNTTTGESRVLTAGDAVQASWSPNNKRIAYWSVQDGSQRDIWTISPNGGEAVPVTQDAFLDFNPVWSPDGGYLYFISNRKGTFSIWRVAMDEASGKALAEPELVFLSSSRAGHISFSSDGKHMVFMQMTSTQNAHRLVFDALAEKIIGQPTAVTQGSTAATLPSISPDGTLLVYMGRVIDVELFVMKVGATIPTQITENSGNNMVPRWSPDGKQIAVYSNQSGVYEIYIMNSDGSGRRQLTEVGGNGVVYPVWSSVDKRLAYSLLGGKTCIMDLSKPFKEQTPEETPLFKDSTDYFRVWDWSPDGKYLLGNRVTVNDSDQGIYTYSLETKEYEQITESGDRPLWLNDNRRFLFRSDGKIYIVDRYLKKPNELYSFSPNNISNPSITRDNRSIYIGIALNEADVWLHSLE